MSDTQSGAGTHGHLGLRITIGVVGLALLALFAMLGSVAMKQSAATQSMETQTSARGDAESAPARE